MVEHDREGVQRSYLASEELYGALRDLQERNLIVPVVGDFGGPKALRSVAHYLDLHHAVVSAFYTSNVEQYLFRDDGWQHFYDNVSQLPLDSRSTFIRAFFSSQVRIFQNMAPVPPGSGYSGSRFSPLPGPRSEQLLNPISVLLSAYQEGRINSYYDVIDLSMAR